MYTNVKSAKQKLKLAYPRPRNLPKHTRYIFQYQNTDIIFISYIKLAKHSEVVGEVIGVGGDIYLVGDPLDILLHQNCVDTILCFGCLTTGALQEIKKLQTLKCFYTTIAYYLITLFLHVCSRFTKNGQIVRLAS